MRWFLQVLIAAALPLTGCTVAGSTVLNKALTSESEGVQYALPIGLVPFRLSVVQSTATFTVTVDAPTYTADPHHRYLLKYRPNINYDDDLTIALNGKSFLKQVKADVTDRTGDILVELARATSAPGQYQGATQDSETLLLTLVEDLARDDVSDRLSRQLSAKVDEYARRMHTECTADPELKKSTPIACAEYKKITDKPKDTQHIRISIARPPTVKSETPADCERGICYRASQPFFIEASFTGRSSARAVVELPNDSPKLALNIDRAFLVQKVTTIDFDENTGLLSGLRINKKSEALAAAKLPLEIAKAVLDVSLLKLRVDYSSQQEALLKKEIAIAEDVEKLRAARQQLQAATTPGPLLTTTSAPRLPKAAGGAGRPDVPGTPGGTPGSNPPGGTPSNGGATRPNPLDKK